MSKRGLHAPYMPSVVVPNTATSEFSYSVSYLRNTAIELLGQVWYLIVSIPDLCTPTFFPIVYRGVPEGNIKVRRGWVWEGVSPSHTLGKKIKI